MLKYICSLPNLFTVECLILSKAFLVNCGDQIVFVLHFDDLFYLLIYLCLTIINNDNILFYMLMFFEDLRSWGN